MTVPMSWATIALVWVGLFALWMAATTLFETVRMWRKPRTGLAYLGTAWVCEDCLMAEAYPSEHPHAGAWSRIGDCIVTPGIITNEHLCMIDGEIQEGCGCETITFSRCACDGCGSRDHGARHGYTMWAA